MVGTCYIVLCQVAFLLLEMILVHSGAGGGVGGAFKSKSVMPIACFELSKTLNSQSASGSAQVYIYGFW